MSTPLEIAAIGYAVSPIVSFMVNKTLDKLSKPLKRTYGIDADLEKLNADLEKLKQILPRVQSVVSVAETRKVVNPHQADLLRQMKEAVYDADDVVDEFNYKLLEAEAAVEDSLAEKFGAMVLKGGKRLFGVDPLQTSLSQAIKGLERVKKTAQAFMDVANFQKITADTGSICGTLQTTPYRETDRFRYSLVLGREKEKDIITRAMLEQANRSSPPLVISVVGAGGIGKTTLAQSIYNHEKFDSAFSTKIWVMVGSDINEGVTKKILAQVSSVPQEPQMYTLELKNSLSPKKFLLVLDDVWVDEEKYDQQERTNLWMTWIFGPLQKCNVGSSILVTTRLESVVKMVGSNINIDVPELSWEHSCSLFELHAFPSGIGSVTNMEELWKIGKEIIRKLKGSPLALKVVGGQLSNNASVKEWTRVLKNALSEKITDILRLSYDNLPSHLKLCFGYCSLFPKGYYFREYQVDQLIHMWIAQGFVQTNNEAGLSLENIGRSYFDDLCSRSLFQRIRTYYVMHDLINDLALTVSKEECCQMLNDQSCISSTLRHVSVSSIHLPILSKIPRLDKLRTLLVLNQSGEHVCIPMRDEILASLIGARVLDLSGCCIDQLPETIEQMIHLRYLAFDRTSTLLPETCSRLFNLQVVSLIDRRSEKYFRRGKCRKGLDRCAPKYMSSLNNLRHVYVLDEHPFDDENRIEITGYWKIPQFHGDAVFAVNNGNKLEDIRDIGFQGSLVIRELENVASKHDALKAQIGRNEQMKELILEWCSSTGACRNNDNDVLDVLQPPSNLTSLIVHGYLGKKYPFWLENNSLTKLCNLNLINCSKLMELPPLGDLPKLKYLTIYGLKAVNKIPEKFYGTKENKGFPSLKLLKVINMQNLEEWSMPVHFPLFPLLEQVIIGECSKLRELPPLGDLPKLKCLIIR